MTNLLFVYGTLKGSHGGIMSERLASVSKLISDKAFVYGEIYNLGGFPAYLETDEGDEPKPVYGELLELNAPESALKWLDGYEGVPYLYTREYADVFVPADGSSEPVKAYIYVYARVPRGEPIPNGIWHKGLGSSIKYAKELA